jgi:cysteine desulfurase
VGIVGLGVALRIARERRVTESPRQAKLRDRLIAGVLTRVSDAVLNGHPTERLPNNASFCIPGTEGESLIVALDLEGFAVSSGSACTSGETEPSQVLLALGLDRELAKGSLRVTVGRSTTEAQVDRFVDALSRVVTRLRDSAAVAV